MKHKSHVFNVHSLGNKVSQMIIIKIIPEKIAEGPNHKKLYRVSTILSTLLQAICKYLDFASMVTRMLYNVTLDSSYI